MISENNSELDSLTRNARLPSLLALRCFEAAARLGNFSRAATELHLTPSAISRSVRLLEDDLGVALFERRRRRVFLTQAGERLAKAVGDGLGLMGQAVNELREKSRRSRQRVLSCEPTLLMRWLIPRWGEFQARHPGHEIHLVAGGGMFSFDQGIDVAIRRDDAPWPEHYHVETLFPERVGPVCRPDKISEWFTSRGARLRSKAPVLETKTRPRAWREWADAAGQPPPTQTAQAFEHFYFSLQAAVAGLGVAIGPWHLVCDDFQSGILAAPLGFVEDGSRYCLLFPEAPQSGSLEMDLLEWLRMAG
ncbi:LysR family transcriptional regulator [Pseudomonas sp. BN417]|uniref:LysR family transcriptional regulator n=1 Tax=Pseudomonas sp. BN417 TaxID=2567890 RepID=UPI002456E126|nr:LysR family transcriptional regulator [Pseudomonas sp. BN417]MDH4557836.1 LysR family transcriptional regulator [Pseudomonas sp. BN417]